MFVELGAVPPMAYLEADPEIVLEVLRPWLESAKALGIGTFIEFTPEGVGRRPDIVKYVADEVGLPTMLVTGIYREPYMPDWAYTAHRRGDRRLPAHRADRGRDRHGVPQPASSSSRQNDTGMTLTERKILEAACIVAKETGSAIASHITAGPTALSVMDALARFGCPQDEVRFIWVHAMVTAAAEGAKLEGDRVGADPGLEYLMAALERGAYVSLDGIGSGYWTDCYGGYDLNIDWISQFVDAGYEDQIIIGADTGWFDPGQPAGFEIEQVDGVWTSVGDLAQDYDSVPGEFVPAMQDAGFSDELITKLMHGNPWSAFSQVAAGGPVAPDRTCPVDRITDRRWCGSRREEAAWGRRASRTGVLPSSLRVGHRCSSPLLCSSVRCELRCTHVQLHKGRRMTTRSPRGTVVALSLAATIVIGMSLAATGSTEPSATFRCNGVVATIVGTNGNDEIKGTNGRDVIVARGGNDEIYGRGGNDLICAGAGVDDVEAGAGNDRVYGGGGNDDLEGQDGADRIFGGGGNDELYGHAGDDLLDGGAGFDEGKGGPGSDTCRQIERRYGC